MPFVKGNTIGQETRFKTAQSGNPAGRPPDKLRRHIYAELDKIEREPRRLSQGVVDPKAPLSQRIGSSNALCCV